MHKEYKFRNALTDVQAKWLLMVIGSHRDDGVLVCPCCEKIYGVKCEDDIIAAFQKKFSNVKVYEVR